MVYCSGIDASQACQTQAVCDNAATLAALANADEEAGNTKSPEITMYIPKISMHEYGSVYVQPGATARPFAPCYHSAPLASAASLKAAGNVNATQYPCALSAADDVEGDITVYFKPVVQTIRFGESFFDLDQHGTGVVLPGKALHSSLIVGS